MLKKRTTATMSVSVRCCLRAMVSICVGKFVVCEPRSCRLEVVSPDHQAVGP